MGAPTKISCCVLVVFVGRLNPTAQQICSNQNQGAFETSWPLVLDFWKTSPCWRNTLLGRITYPIERHFWVDDFPNFPRWDMLAPSKVCSKNSGSPLTNKGTKQKSHPHPLLTAGAIRSSLHHLPQSRSCWNVWWSYRPNTLPPRSAWHRRDVGSRDHGVFFGWDEGWWPAPNIFILGAPKYLHMTHDTSS